MKKIKLIFASLLMAATVLSCDDDGGTSKNNVDQGGVPDIQKIETSDSFINLNNLLNGEDFSIGVTVDVGLGDVVSIDLIGFYIKANGDTERTVLAQGITTFPSTFTFTNESLIAAFTSLNSDTDFELGDQLIITGNVTLGNGTVLKLLTDEGEQNFGTYLDPSQAPYSVYQTFTVSCPSDLGGTFVTTNTNLSAPTGEAEAGPITGEVTFTDNGGGSYLISDASFGGWIGLYGPDNIATGLSLTDVCGQLSLSGVDQYGEIFTYSDLVVDGANLSLHWENDYGEFGDVVITRTDGTEWPTDLTLAP
jgi:hypothetical protein